jgi:hypothetical protein
MTNLRLAIKLQAACIMNTNTTAPGWDIQDVRLLACHQLVQSGVPKGSSPGTTFQPYSMHYSLTPEELRQAAVVNHCPDLLEESVVETLGDPIVLWHVMDCQLLSGALFIQVCIELFAIVFAPSVCAKHLDSDTLLSQQSSLKCFV